jgi:hypothetical protein
MAQGPERWGTRSPAHRSYTPPHLGSWIRVGPRKLTGPAPPTLVGRADVRDSRPWDSLEVSGDRRQLGISTVGAHRDAGQKQQTPRTFITPCATAAPLSQHRKAYPALLPKSRPGFQHITQLNQITKAAACQGIMESACVAYCVT